MIPQNSSASLNPYEFPKLLWSLTEDYFKKYDVVFTKALNTGAVQKPTIVYRIRRRTPGVGQFGNAGKTGSSYRSTSLESETGYDGNLTENFVRGYRVIYEFSVCGTAADVVEAISWDLELIIEQLGAPLKEILGSELLINFLEQSESDTLARRNQDDMYINTFAIIVDLPIYTTQVFKKLDIIEIVQRYGLVEKNQIEFTRTSSSSNFTLPLDDSETIVKSINFVTLTVSGENYLLVRDVDYEVWKSAETGSLYLKWVSDGRPPNVGETFYVTYTTMPVYHKSTLST